MPVRIVNINGKKFHLNKTDGTGCSTRFVELLPGGPSDDKSTYEVEWTINSLYQLLVRQREHKGDGKRCSALFFRDMPNLDSKLASPTKCLLHEYTFYRLFEGGRVVALFAYSNFDNDDDECEYEPALFETVHGMRRHLPWCHLRPWEMVNPELMAKSGMIRILHGPGNSSGYRTVNEEHEYEYDYGCNNDFLPKLRDDQCNFKPHYSVQWGGSYWGEGKTTKKVLITTNLHANRMGDGVGITEKHRSDEVNALMGCDAAYKSWWISAYFAGIEYLQPEELVEAVTKERCSSARSDDDVLHFIGGNWNCTSSTDSIRVFMAFAERMRKSNRGPMAGAHWAETKDRKRAYFNIVPWVFESPQHRDHPSSVMMLSNKPLVWERVR